MNAGAVQSCLRRGISFVPTFSSAVIMLAGGLVLLGWALDIRGLIQLLPVMVSMNPVTALSFMLAGLSLWCFRGGTNHVPVERRNLGIGLAVIVALVGVVKLVDYLLPMSFHVDQLFFRRKLALPGLYPLNEMAPNTALNFLFCGLALLCFEKGKPRGFCPSQLFILPAALISVLALIGYSYRELVFYKLGTTLPMSIDTALAFTLFCVGLLAAQADRGLMRVLISRTTGGTMARRLLPMALLIPWSLGALVLWFEQSGFYGPEFAVSVFAVACILLFVGLIWWNARLAYLNDLGRIRAQQHLRVQHDTTRALAESSNLPEVVPTILKVLGEGLGWEAGLMWSVDSVSGTLHCGGHWQSPGLGASDFLTRRQATTLAKGQGIPGHVWQTALPVWLEEITNAADLPQADSVAKSGFQSALGFPLAGGKELLGVLEFFSHKSQPRDGAVLRVLAAVGTQMNLLMERAGAEEQLRKTSAELQRSNTDLQQFAYIASHDLFEPLRMITSYLQLLEERSSSKLDPQSREFVGFAIDGARRMNALIHDLLAYARVDLRGRAFEPVDCQQAFAGAIANLKVAIEESSTTISHSPLPTVWGDEVQLRQVFQNLIGNAIKFRGQQKPQISVDAQRRNEEWLFCVADNGIGIDPKDFERIFVIFRRLHTREQYAGTGMGLAICKKIIERHGGRIWVQSSPGAGTVFYFTLPIFNEERASANPSLKAGS